MPVLTAVATNSLKDVVTSDMLQGVLDEFFGIIPVVLPVAIGYIAIRKAWGFLMGTLRGA